MPFDGAAIALLSVFIIGYLFIAFEPFVGVRRATSALLMGVTAWVIEFSRTSTSHAEHIQYFGEHLSSIAQVIIFLMGALTIVEVINSHDGFRMIRNFLTSTSKKKLFWSLGLVAFLLSAVFGSLNTMMVIIPFLLQVTSNSEDRWTLGSGALIAANAGGAFSAIGDITSTMLWVGEQLNSLTLLKYVFLPSLVSCLTGLLCLQFRLKGVFSTAKDPEEKASRLSKGIFALGLGALLFVPIFKELTGLPPFMGILIGLSVVWLVTDLLHASDEDRHHLTVTKAIGRLDFEGPIFFLGILLAIQALETSGIFDVLAGPLLAAGALTSSPLWVGSWIGGLSALIDNIPLTAALMGTFPPQVVPNEHPFWLLLAYSAGVGGSLLITGSAAGIALMGLEKIRFGWYLKSCTLPAIAAFLAGLLTFYLY